jgi:hypothetical protein
VSKIRINKVYEYYGNEVVDEYWVADNGTDAYGFFTWADAMSFVHIKWLNKPIPAGFFRQSQWGPVL